MVVNGSLNIVRITAVVFVSGCGTHDISACGCVELWWRPSFTEVMVVNVIVAEYMSVAGLKVLKKNGTKSLRKYTSYCLKVASGRVGMLTLSH